MTGIIYIIRNLKDGKVYIGQTRRSLKDRWREHCRCLCSKNEKNMSIKHAIMKEGKENFSVEILETCDVNDLNEREYFYIKKYNAANPAFGYNGTCGGSSIGKPLKLNKEQQQECVSLYREGKSLNYIARVFEVDHATVRSLLLRHKIALRTTKTYKFSQDDRKKIFEELKIMSRKEIMRKWGMSKSYLSQLANGGRRI